MRQATMANFVINEKRSIYRAHAMSVSRYREDYLVQDAEKSKQLLQELLQDKVRTIMFYCFQSKLLLKMSCLDER